MFLKQSGIVLLLCGLPLSCQKVPPAKVTAPTPTGWVSGSVAAIVTDAKESRSIDLPGVTVQLRRAADEQLVATAVSDRAGSYAIGPQPSGRYQLCWALSDNVSETAITPKFREQGDRVAIHVLHDQQSTMSSS
jgi:hypothetical protein